MTNLLFDAPAKRPPFERESCVSGGHTRTGPEVLSATRSFEERSQATSWWYVASTFAFMIAALSGAGLLHWWPARLVLSALGALLMVRAFIAFHDYMHGAILRDSRAASALFHLYGFLTLTPARSWKRSHNYHHGHVGRITDEGIGAFPIITANMWRNANPARRLIYRASRHPLIVLFGYITVFAFSICIQPFLRDPRRHWDSALSVAAHGSLICILWLAGGFKLTFFVALLPMTLASQLGSYLFFAQHSFDQMVLCAPEPWDFFRAAMQSSSFIRLNPVLRWFTGNIGYHHVHHLNVRIPFYRLPEAMASVPELQSPRETSLSFDEVMRCFRANLWDEDRQHMVSYRTADGV